MCQFGLTTTVVQCLLRSTSESTSKCIYKNMFVEGFLKDADIVICTIHITQSTLRRSSNQTSSCSKKSVRLYHHTEYYAPLKSARTASHEKMVASQSTLMKTISSTKQRRERTKKHKHQQKVFNINSAAPPLWSTPRSEASPRQLDQAPICTGSPPAAIPNAI